MLKPMIWMVSLILAAGLAACNLPGPFGAATHPATQAQATRPINLSPVVFTSTPVRETPSPIPAMTLTPSPTASLTANTTLLVTASPAGPCDRAAPGSPLDISIPDDTSMSPGQAFSKTWRLVNDGSCTWTQDYAVVYFSGAQMSAPASNHLPVQVLPGESADVSIEMAAPAHPGVYQGNWKLSNKTGQLFGLGPNGDAPFWVRVMVAEQATPTLTPPPPTPTPTTTPVLYVSGQAILNPNDSLDLDTNTITNDTTADVQYLYVDAPPHQLAPINGARLGVPGGSTPPTYLECTTASLNTNVLKLDDLAPNTTFCYRTNLGLPGWARLVSLDPGTHVLTLEITTWAIP
jgi:hypothetical protein